MRIARMLLGMRNGPFVLWVLGTPLFVWWFVSKEDPLLLERMMQADPKANFIWFIALLFYVMAAIRLYEKK